MRCGCYSDKFREKYNFVAAAENFAAETICTLLRLLIVFAVTKLFCCPIFCCFFFVCNETFIFTLRFCDSNNIMNKYNFFLLQPKIVLPQLNVLFMQPNILTL